MNNQVHPKRIHLEHAIEKVNKGIVVLLFESFSHLGKQKWVPLPLDNPDGEGEVTEGAPKNAQNNSKTTANKGNRTPRNTRSARGGNRNRTRSLDGATPKRNRKNRPNTAAYNAYQEYYSYYCK